MEALNERPILLWMAVFVGVIVLDYVYAEYTKAAADRNAIVSSNMAMFLIVITGFVTSCYVINQWLLIPAAAGAWVGTYLSIKYGK